MDCNPCHDELTFSLMIYLSLQEKKAIAAFKERLLKQFGDQVTSLKLFGSRARGEGDEESDLDVLVLLKEDSLAVRNQILDIATDLFLEYEIDISPTVMTQTHFEDMKRRERLFPQEVERDGQSL